MKINKRNARILWYERYGDILIEEDFDGAIMHRDAYGVENAVTYINGEKIYCGWNIHHILPINQEGSNAKENLVCTNIITNKLAGNKTTFYIDNIKYQVKKVKGTHNEYWIDTI